MKVLVDALFDRKSRMVPANREHCQSMSDIGFDAEKTILVTTDRGAHVYLAIETVGDTSLFAAIFSQSFGKEDFDALPKLKHFEPSHMEYGDSGARELENAYFSGIIMDREGRYVVHARLNGIEPPRWAS